MSELNELKQKMQDAYNNWDEKIYKKSVAKAPEWKKEFTTASFTPVKPLYTSNDIKQEESIERLGFPGEYPFTRGVQPTMYRGRLWTMRQYAGFGNAKESNERYRYLLGQGQMGLSVAFDLPTQIGYDSDDPIAYGEVGKVGVAIDTLADMEILFNQIPLDKVSTSMTINAPASVLLALYIAVGEKQGFTRDKLSGTIQNDILKEYIARGTYIYPTKPSMRLITNIFEFCTKEVPKWNTISISGYHIREAGSTAAQEVGFTLADGIAYVDAAIKAGLDVDKFAGRLSFFFNAHNDLFEEVAKYRAARRLWAKIMRERFGAKDPKSWMLRFHTQTAGSTLTAQQVDNNISRVTIQTLAAVLGGTQSLHTNSKDEALALPTQQAVQIALRTQQVVAHESGVTNTIDPLGGSYYVEAMTDQIESEAAEYIAKIDTYGGAPEAIEAGFQQSEIQKAAYRYEKEIEAGERVIVGLNKFQVKEPPVTGLLKIDIKVQEEQIKFLNEIKKQRSAEEVKSKLALLIQAAEGDANLMPFIID
ncbi:MAG: methylmalonyl-CoA mutase family protein, partial [Ignavibacteriales bacterium]|nr:methylmalonyl-CoA mutase family protein [Ignavibacteriales bacterium]